MYKVTEKDGEKFVTVEMNLKLEIFLGNSDSVPNEVDLDLIEERFCIMDRHEIGDCVLNQINLEEGLVKN
jgi:hypothetical protein